MENTRRKRKIFLYGLAGAEKAYMPLWYRGIYIEERAIEEIKLAATSMVIFKPDVSMVYAIDQRYGLQWDYLEALKKHDMEAYACFKDILEREGLRVI